MFRVIAVCAKCKKEASAYDDGDCIMIIDFAKKEFSYSCPSCGHMNVFMFSDKKENERKPFPRISFQR